MITKRELRKQALMHISAVILSHDLAYLFSDDLYDLGFEPEGEWVHEFLKNIQISVSKRIIPKKLRGEEC